MILKKLLLLVFIYTSLMLYSQNNYWTQQYGARSSLLSGAVVGSVVDNSAIYYNPAGIGFIDSSYLSVSANVYGFDYVNLENGAGTNLNLSSFQTSIYPQLVSGLIKFKFIPKLKMSYGLLTRYRTGVKSHVEVRQDIDAIPMEPGLEYHYGTYDFELNNSSLWGCFSMAYKISNKVSIGLSNFITYTHFDDKRNLVSSADVVQPTYAYTAQFNSFSTSIIDHIGYIGKLGVQWHINKNFSFGSALTLPQISIFGTSRLLRTIEYFNQDRFIDDSVAIGRFSSWVASDDRSNLKAQMNHPLSISVGLTWNVLKTRSRFHFSSEFFFPINKYTVAKSDSIVYVRPTALYNGAQVPNLMTVQTQSSGVLNLAFAYEQDFFKKFTFYLGVRSDLNNGVEFNGLKPLVLNTLNPIYNHYLHFTGGFSYRRGHSDFSIGLNYGFGITNLRRAPLNLSDPSVGFNDNGGYFILQGPRKDDMVSTAHNLLLIIGYTYYIKRS